MIIVGSNDHKVKVDWLYLMKIVIRTVRGDQELICTTEIVFENGGIRICIPLLFSIILCIMVYKPQLNKSEILIFSIWGGKY